MTVRGCIRVAGWLFTVVGLVALGYYATVWIGAKLYQARESHRFTREAHRRAKAAPAAPHAQLPVVAPPNGSPLGKLEIPRIGVSVIVVEGVDARDLKLAVGHIPGTALPGQAGNIALAGHRDTFFRPLRAIHRDDTITLTTLGGSCRYRVVSTEVVSPKDVKVLCPTGRDTLTLVTCYPFYYVGSAPRRFIVCADRLPDAGTKRIGGSHVQT